MIYLDNAATTMHKPQTVIDAVTQAMCSLGNAGRGATSGALDAARTIHACRAKLARLLGCPRADHVCFTPNSTAALNTAINGVVRPGDRVVTTVLEHNSVLRPLNRLAANLEELGLEGMASSVPEYVRLVADGRKSLVDAMLELTDAQIALKRRADDERRTRMANFPYIKTLADFDWGFQPSVPRGLVEQLATLEFVDRGDNVVLVGSPGVGKTHLSIAIGHEAVMARKQVYFADCSRLVEDLKHASAKEALARRMRFYEHCSLLIIDELGYLDIGKEGADLLFQLVNRRYALKRSTIVTTNVPVGRWGDVFGSNVTASAVADRLCHHCAMIKITGRSYRLKDVSIGGEDGKEEGA